MVFFVLFNIFSLDADAKKTAKPKKPKKLSAFQKIVANSEIYPGLFTVYQDKNTGKSHILIKKTDLKQAFIYATYIEDSPLLAGNFRGKYYQNFIFKINKQFDHLEWKQINTDFFFDKNNALHVAETANISESLFYKAKIVAEDKKKGHYLIEADTLFKSELLRKISPSSKAPALFSLGALNLSKSKIEKIESYPENLNIMSSYHFENKRATLAEPFTGITDPRFIDVKVRHILLQVPKNNFKPRKYDFRVGYFSTQQNDLTSTAYLNFKDVIHRWHLEKKNPEQSLSEVKVPIVWWIEKSTPKDLIPAIKEGVLAWNKAFEAVGLKNALQVRIQPENAKWEAGDIRYNVLRWTSSPKPLFGGYGPSIVNPLTGQIIAADIMLEWVFFTNRIKLENIYLNQDNTDCNQDLHLQNQLQNALLANNDISDSQLKHEAIVDLIMHEVGHTLGLTHNFMASRLHTMKDLHNTALTKENGLYASVMDYTPANIHIDEKKQGQYFATTIGPYDKWAIAYGYETEEKNLSSILEKSTLAENIYANDSEDMRSPGKGIDPRVMINDLSKEPLNFAESQLKIIQKIIPNLSAKSLPNTLNYASYKKNLDILLSQYKRQLVVISRFIGGIYSHRQANPQSQIAFTPVDRSDQLQALNLLDKYLFDENSLAFLGKAFNNYQEVRRGFNLMNTIQSPQPIQKITAIQQEIFAHLLHPNTLNRLYDSRTFSNSWKLEKYLSELNEKVFSESFFKEANLFKHSLQITYTQSLINLYSNNTALYPGIKATLKQLLQEIYNQNQKAFFLSKSKKAQRSYIQNLIKHYL